MKNRRFEGRYMCADMVHMDWLASESNFRSSEAVLEDISALGGCVQLEEPIPVGSLIMLTLGETPFYGHACYCMHRDEGYFVGLRFSNDSVWSPEVVRPRHLTSLRELCLQAEGCR